MILTINNSYARKKISKLLWNGEKFDQEKKRKSFSFSVLRKMMSVNLAQAATPTCKIHNTKETQKKTTKTYNEYI